MRTCLAFIGWETLLIIGVLPASFASAADAPVPPAAAVKLLEAAYPAEIQPLLRRYCHECHNEDKTEADVDLTAFSTWAAVRQQPQVWQKVAEMLDSGQMPPKDAPQPTAADKTRLQQWVGSFLTHEAAARAGDPGRVVLRRLSNAEFTYTLRDLTAIPSLDPAREFPVDGAAGEGFTNTGNALVMSPALVGKYLEAAKQVAAHAVLLPDGFRFSPHTTSRDWTEATLAEIRDLYRQFTDPTGGDRVNLQGIVFDTNAGGRLPVEAYLAATLVERESLRTGQRTIEQAARAHGLSPRYLGILWSSLNSREPSLLLDGLRARWRAATPEGAPALAAEIAAWQKGLWRFNSVGHIGKLNGPRAWLEPVSPVIAKQELRYKILPPAEGDVVTLSLLASDAGDGHDHDYVVWQQPRLVAPGRPDLLLRDVRAIARTLSDRRARIFANSARYLHAAEQLDAARGKGDVAATAKKLGLEPDALLAWLNYLGIGAGGPVELRGHFTNKVDSAGGYAFIKGWGAPETPLLYANSSDQYVRIPGNIPPHSVVVHPSPKLKTAVGWRSPVSAELRIEAEVIHAHPECGNGVLWSLELRRGDTRRQFATGLAIAGTRGRPAPIEKLSVQKGDVISLLIGPRDGNHYCDLSIVELKLTEKNGRAWSLWEEVSPDVLSGNPHRDKFGHEGVWHFYTEADTPGDANAVIPAGSLLARWQSAGTPEQKRQLADEVQKLLLSGRSTAAGEAAAADIASYRQAAALGGPLFVRMLRDATANKPAQGTGVVGSAPPAAAAKPEAAWGLDPALFGRHPNGTPVDAASLCVQAPAELTVRLPADLVADCELVTTGVLHTPTGAEGSVQLEIAPSKPAREAGLVPSEVKVTVAKGPWTSDNRQTVYGKPVVVNEGSATHRRIEASLDEFRQLFPAALCYTRIVPVDEVVTLTLFYREDEHLVRLMLDDAQRARLDRLWSELRFISRDALTLVDAFAQLLEYATQDADPKVFEPLRKPINDRAAAFRQLLLDSEPRQVDRLIAFAGQAWRRPVTTDEERQLRELYASLREQELPHAQAFRLLLARVLVAPAFLYKIEKPAPGAGQGPVSDEELASRLSYFLWSSQPDEALRRVAADGTLRNPDVLVSQMRRMLADPRTRRLATEFGCQWLHIRDFDHVDEKSERHFPTFTSLRGAMYEESILFFTDLFQNDRPLTALLDADYTFVNDALAAHYGLTADPKAASPPPAGTGAPLPEGWRRVDGVRQHGRGGILAQATTLATQSGASRTSPVLRGNWISEVLLGERLPRPPKGVPPLPDDEAATETLTVRQLVEKHASDAKCAVCHRRIDPLGFSLERFDAIGRRRDNDLAGRPIDTRVETVDGARFDGLDGLRNYLLTARRAAFTRQFCRKLLGYALGRAVQLSDEPLLTEMQAALEAHEQRVVPVIETILRSRQFREIRGLETAWQD